MTIRYKALDMKGIQLTEQIFLIRTSKGNPLMVITEILI